MHILGNPIVSFFVLFFFLSFSAHTHPYAHATHLHTQRIHTPAYPRPPPSSKVFLFFSSPSPHPSARNASIPPSTIRIREDTQRIHVPTRPHPTKFFFFLFSFFTLIRVRTQRICTPTRQLPSSASTLCVCTQHIRTHAHIHHPLKQVQVFYFLCFFFLYADLCWHAAHLHAVDKLSARR